jgi:hypothetical protein
MRSFLQRHSQDAILAAVLSCALGAAISLVSAYVSYHYTQVGQDRQARLEQVSKFDAASVQIIDAGGSFILVINESKDPVAARQKLRAVIADQIHETESFRKFYGKNVGARIEEYQSALAELNQVAQRTASVTDMRPWAESFGRVLDAKSALSESLYTALGMDVGTKRDGSG